MRFAGCFGLEWQVKWCVLLAETAVFALQSGRDGRVKWASLPSKVAFFTRPSRADCAVVSLKSLIESALSKSLIFAFFSMKAGRERKESILAALNSGPV